MPVFIHPSDVSGADTLIPAGAGGEMVPAGKVRHLPDPTNGSKCSCKLYHSALPSSFKSVQGKRNNGSRAVALRAAHPVQCRECFTAYGELPHEVGFFADAMKIGINPDVKIAHRANRKALAAAARTREKIAAKMLRDRQAKSAAKRAAADAKEKSA